MSITADYHIHCGQYEKAYYQPAHVIKSLYRNGIKEAWLSSTTSNIMWNNADEKSMLIQHIKDELSEALYTAKQYGMRVKPLYWVVVNRHNEGETISDVMDDFPYGGFKIHPRLPGWELSNAFVLPLFEEICRYASDYHMPVLIHTGIDPEDIPSRFEAYFSAFPKVEFVLAHCKQHDIVIRLFEQYKNVYGDCSFCPEKIYRTICDAGFAERIRFGTDFPITHWYTNPSDCSLNELTEHYKNIIQNQYCIPKDAYRRLKISFKRLNLYICVYTRKNASNSSNPPCG